MNYCLSAYKEVTSYSLDDIDKALERLSHPIRLDHARRRFDKSPPYWDTPLRGPVRDPSRLGNIRYAPRVREQKEQSLVQDYLKSKPALQFQTQLYEEEELRNAASWYIPPGTTATSSLRDRVRTRWIEQGIWNDEWDPKDPFPVGRRSKWKHEQPPTVLHDCEPHSGDQPGGQQSATGQWFTQDQHREASRPFFQFMYQVSMQRRFIEEKFKYPEYGGEERLPFPPNANTTAYKIVNKRWKKNGLWDSNWGDMLPGMSWRHEETIEDFVWDEMGDLSRSPSPVTRPPSVEGHEPESHWTLAGRQTPESEEEDPAPVRDKETRKRRAIPWEQFGLPVPKKRREMYSETSTESGLGETLAQGPADNLPGPSGEQVSGDLGANQETAGGTCAVPEWSFGTPSQPPSPSPSPANSVDSFDAWLKQFEQEEDQYEELSDEHTSSQREGQTGEQLEEERGQHLENQLEKKLDQPRDQPGIQSEQQPGNQSKPDD